MSRTVTMLKTTSMLFGVAAGTAIGAALIGFVLIGIAIASDLRSDASAVLFQHPLFVAGAQLISSCLTLGLLLFMVRYVWNKSVTANGALNGAPNDSDREI